MKEPVAPSPRVTSWWPIAALCAVVMLPVLIVIFSIEERNKVEIGKIMAPVENQWATIAEDLWCEQIQFGTKDPAHFTHFRLKTYSTKTGWKIHTVQSGFNLDSGVTKMYVQSMLTIPIPMWYERGLPSDNC